MSLDYTAATETETTEIKTKKIPKPASSLHTPFSDATISPRSKTPYTASTVSFRNDNDHTTPGKRLSSPYASHHHQPKLPNTQSVHSKLFNKKSSYKTSTTSSTTAPSLDNDLPNYAKPLRRSVEKAANTSQGKITADNNASENRVIKTSSVNNGGSGTSVFDRLSKHKKSSSFKNEEAVGNSETTVSKKSNSLINNKRHSLTLANNKPSVSSNASKSPSVGNTKVSSRLRTNSISVGDHEANNVQKTVPSKNNSLLFSSQSISTQNSNASKHSPMVKRQSRDASKRTESVSRKSVAKVDTTINNINKTNESKSQQLVLKSKSSRKIRKRKSSKFGVNPSLSSSISQTKTKEHEEVSTDTIKKRLSKVKSSQNAVNKPETETAVNKSINKSPSAVDNKQTLVKKDPSSIINVTNKSVSDTPLGVIEMETPAQITDKNGDENMSKLGNTELDTNLSEDQKNNHLLSELEQGNREVENELNKKTVSNEDTVMKKSEELQVGKYESKTGPIINDQTIKPNTLSESPPAETLDDVDTGNSVLTVRSTIQSIGANSSTRELVDIPENEPLPPSASSRAVTGRLSRPQRSGFTPSVVGSGPIVSKVSLTFEDVAQFGQQQSSEQTLRRNPSKSTNGNADHVVANASKSGTRSSAGTLIDQPSLTITNTANGGTAVQTNAGASNSILYNPSVSSMKPTVSSVKFLPTSANNNDSSSSNRQMIVSQSARSLVSNSASRSSYHHRGSGGARRSSIMSKSRSVGSPRLSGDSFTRRYGAPTPFKESIPNVLDMEYESTKVPSINDIISRRSSAKMAAAAAAAANNVSASGGNVWVPSDSLVRSAALASENIHSPSTIIASTSTANTTPASGKSVSGSQIFVTPVASNKFVASSPRASARDTIKRSDDIDGKTEK